MIRYPRLATATTLAFATAFVTMLSRMYSPFIVAPGIAALIGMMMMSTPLFRQRWLLATTIALLGLAVIAPYLLEIIGALSPTITIANEQIHISNLAVRVHPLQTGVGLAGFAIGIIGVATTLSWIVVGRDAATQRQLQIQAWQLRQLVPEPADIPDRG